ncbi:MAG: (2Fe-2S)-binding protein [Sulfolobales archaeon]|nr:(2Fe-2S)-binding protein [Sulfolobales archaeon]MCX8208150.1 (2Fe-2S)-binding protein [Sulfolobales archaeon]MDW8010559.1 (2Fe-2S)-binding protein [Sulfolobales archaeon]
MRVVFTLNGRVVEVDVEPSEILLDTLRLKLGVKSVKRGCERGECGACTVLVNDAPVVSCLLLTVQINGSSVTTVEGLQSDSLFMELASEFGKNFAVQCGYCSPAMILTSYAFIKKVLENSVKPSREDIVRAIEGNLCRCGTYPRVVRSIEKVLERRAKAAPQI